MPGEPRYDNEYKNKQHEKARRQHSNEKRNLKMRKWKMKKET